MHFYPIVGLTYQCQNKYTQGASKFQTLANCHVLLDSAVRSIFKCQHSETWQMESYISDGNTALPLHQIHNLICWILWRQSGNVNFSVEFNPGRITSQVFGPQNNTLSQQHQESLSPEFKGEQSFYCCLCENYTPPKPFPRTLWFLNLDNKCTSSSLLLKNWRVCCQLSVFSTVRAKTKVNKLSFPRSTKWRSLVAGLAVSCLATFFWLFDLTFKPPALWSLRSWKKVAVYDIKAYKHTHLFIFFAPYKNEKKDDKNPAAGEKEEEKPCHKKTF